MSSLAYQFGGWLVEPELNRISSGSVERHLEPLTMDVLCHLLENAGQIVSSERVLATVWSGKIVESNAVPRAINQIREALGDDSRAPRYIETIRKRGYRTIVDVSRVGPEPAPETASWDSRPGGYDSGPSRATARRRFTRISVMLLGVGLAVGLLYIQRGAVVTNLILRFPALFFGEPIDQRIGFTETMDGVRIAYATSGVGEPIIHILTVGTHLESGQSSPIYDNDGLVALSSRNNLFVRYDGRGTGLSDRGVDDYALQARLSDLEAVIDTLGLQRFGVLAVSAGGQVAIAYTANHPERVTRLVLAGAVSNYHFDGSRFSK
ncbi:MAG: alpha/beta fold hydrolase, partial [Gammaproteobacteria bacterium]